MSEQDYTRRRFLKTIGLTAAWLTVSRASSPRFEGGTPSTRINAAPPRTDEATGEKHNFVFILVDDLGWMDTGCYGSRFYETPNIDKLAAQGMQFTDGYAACAVCSPTRAAVMTGRYPARLGVTDWIRSRFQGGAIPDNKKNPTDYVGGKDKKL
ncbi:MAG: sulfatase-like hydrolase/transferase, partial [Sedimentisphaerales bacterium]